MRHWLLPLTLLSAPVLAQTEPAAAAPAAEAPAAEAPAAPAPPPPTPAPGAEETVIPEAAEEPPGTDAAPAPATPARKPARSATPRPAPKPKPKPPAAAAKKPAAPAPAPTPAPAPAPAPAAAAPAAPSQLSEGALKGLAEAWARDFFSALVLGDARGLAEMAALPFQLEGRRIGTQEELVAEWARQLRDKRTDLLTLYGVEVLTPAQMEQKYGKPPARLGSLELQRPGTLVAVGNLSGRAAVAVLREAGEGVRAVAYTD